MTIARRHTSATASLRRRTHLASWLAIVAIVVVVGALALRRPAGNPDIVFYVATAHSWQGLSGQALSDATYADLRSFLTAEQWADVTGTSGDPTDVGNVYQRAALADPVSLAQQIPFYSVKPLYPALMLTLGMVGVPLPLSTVLISVLSYAVVGLLLFAWARRHHGPIAALVLVGLAVLSPPFWVLAGLSTPDALALALVTGATFAFAELRRPALMVVLMLIAVLARPNTAILALAMLGVAAAATPSSRVRLRPLAAVAAAVATVAIVLAVNRLVGAYPYGTLFYHTLYAYLPYPADGAPPIPFSEILHEYVFLATRLGTTLLPLVSFLAAIAMLLRHRSVVAVRADAPSLLVVGAIAAAVAGWLAFPSGTDRMLVGSSMAVVAVLIAATGTESGSDPLPAA